MSSNVKPLIALGLTAVGTVLVANFQVSEPLITDAQVTTDSQVTTDATTTTPTTPTTTTTTTSSTTARGRASASPTAAPVPATADSTATPTTTAGATYADGTYAGAPVGEPWGTFEVQVTITGGQITDVSLAAAPRDRHSSSINAQAVPMLTQEVIATQSAEIDMLSGATWTSSSYITSLQAALDDAAAAEQQLAG